MEKPSGIELYMSYTDKEDDYAQTLRTAKALFGPVRVYALLEAAENQNKKIALIQDLEMLGEPTGMRLI